MKLSLRPLLFLLLLLMPMDLFAHSSVNIPLGSPLYNYIDKIAGLGLISSDFKGIRPITKSEASRLVLEAEKKSVASPTPEFALELLTEARSYLKRELALRGDSNTTPSLEFKPVSDLSLKYIFLDGLPRSYERGVHDPGGEGVFGIGSGLRPDNPYPSIAQQHGSEGTPLLPNNEGVVYGRGSSLDLTFSTEVVFANQLSLLMEPRLISTAGELQGRLNKGYLKAGGGGLELEVGRDANWLGFGERGALTLSNNARNFDLLKISSPEPIELRWLGMFKYAFILSRFDRVTTSAGERQPWFYAIKASLKPVPDLEIGLNLGRQQGGPGVNNSIRDNIQGLVGGTNSDNSNSLSGVELRWRMPFLRNTEAYIEFSGEDAAKFWPFVESYLAGVYLPRLTEDGRNDFRFEYFLGNNILYSHTQFTEGYIYKGMPIGNSQGGATQDFLFSYSHWFSVRNRAGLSYIYTTRGNTGLLPGQALEEKHGVTGFWNFPLADRMDLRLQYGIESIDNLNLVSGQSRNNSVATAELKAHF